ncbi:PUA-like domain [Trinorchestia longiramus]|nr:PUA-like domain [Trinorchestia longiramus]
MFLKPFRVKSNSQLKTSDKKKLRVQMSQQFPGLSEEDVHQLVPLKEDVAAMKLYSHKGENTVVYLCGGCPLAFTINNHLGCVVLPSVYMCWLYPPASVGTVFHTHPDVLGRLQQGADLMMPGVIISGQLSPTTFGQFEAGSPAVVVSRGAVVAVGTTALSSTDLYMAGGHGKAVISAHVLGDYLWAAGTKAMPNFTEQPVPSAPSSTPVPETPESGTGTGDSQDASGAVDLASCSSCTGSDTPQLQERMNELQVVEAPTSTSPSPQCGGLLGPQCLVICLFVDWCNTNQFSSDHAGTSPPRNLAKNYRSPT